MLSDLPLYYWDACVMLAYVNGYTSRLPHIEGLMQRSGKDFNIITSVYSVTEVAYAAIEQSKQALSPEVEEEINKLWRVGSPIQLVEYYELIAAKAARLIRAGLPKKWSLKPGDAIHLATADHLKVREFHTYDERLDKFAELTDTKFKICRPIAQQPVMIAPPEKPIESEEATKIATAPEIAAVRPSSANPEGQTQSEEKKAT